MSKIIEAHSDVFELQAKFHKQNRLYLIYGNHDIVKRKENFTSKHCDSYPCCCCTNPHLENKPLLPNVKVVEGIILENTSAENTEGIYLTHGHQAELLNSTFWPLARFLVRYVWKPLESFGALNPISAAENSTRKDKTEKRLHNFAQRSSILLIAGHTHRAFLSDSDPHYCNSGSCVHPYSVTFFNTKFFEFIQNTVIF